MSVAPGFGVQEQIKKGTALCEINLEMRTKVKNGDNLSEKNSA